MVKESAHEWSKTNQDAYDTYATAKRNARIRFIEAYKIAYYKRKFTDAQKAPAWCPPSFRNVMEVVDLKVAAPTDKIFLFTIRIPNVDHYWYEKYMEKFLSYKNVKDTDIQWCYEDLKKDGQTKTGLHIHAALHNITSQSKKQFISSMWSAYKYVKKLYPDITPDVNDRAFDIKLLPDWDQALAYVFKNSKCD